MGVGVYTPPFLLINLSYMYTHSEYAWGYVNTTWSLCASVLYRLFMSNVPCCLIHPSMSCEKLHSCKEPDCCEYFLILNQFGSRYGTAGYGTSTLIVLEACTCEVNLTQHKPAPQVQSQTHVG